MRISDWSSDVCSSDLQEAHHGLGIFKHQPDRVGDAHGALNKSPVRQQTPDVPKFKDQRRNKVVFLAIKLRGCRLESRSEEHTSELQSLMRISYAVFCLKKKKKKHNNQNTHI